MNTKDYHELTSAEKKMICDCVRRECANWDNKYGYCVVLDGNCYMNCIGFQESSLCKYFEKAILPTQPALIKLFHKENRVMKNCEACGEEFVALRNQKYCSARCASKSKRKKQAARIRKFRRDKM